MSSAPKDPHAVAVADIRAGLHHARRWVCALGARARRTDGHLTDEALDQLERSESALDELEGDLRRAREAG